MKKFAIVLSIAAGLTAGCQMYKPQDQLLPQHVKNLAIRPFVNSTVQLGLEEKLYMRVYDEFIHSGQYMITTEDKADGILVGEITYYKLQPLTFGPNFEPQQYKLRILLNIYFVDKKQIITLWSEENFEGVNIYDAPTLPGGLTEEDARELIWETLTKKIYRRVVDGFGSESGISEKKVPQDTQKK
jgi:hypothetical protein